jgi:hypothetical protein
MSRKTPLAKPILSQIAHRRLRIIKDMQNDSVQQLAMEANADGVAQISILNTAANLKCRQGLLN